MHPDMLIGFIPLFFLLRMHDPRVSPDDKVSPDDIRYSLFTRGPRQGCVRQNHQHLVLFLYARAQVIPPQPAFFQPLAPILEMHREARSRPLSAHSVRPSPRSTPVRNPATKLSPAPVESTTSTGSAGRWNLPSCPFT